jgi:phosphoadenosine phosphosulfate reductase
LLKKAESPHNRKTMYSTAKKRAEALNGEWSGRDPETILSLAGKRFCAGRIALASSFGAEDQVLTDMIVRTVPEIAVFTLDTGRLHQETYDLLDATRNRYAIPIEVHFPETSEVSAMQTLFGANLFYESVEMRRRCCETRKVRPLEKKLSKLDAWICGLRKGQSVTRDAVRTVEWDERFGLFKINPLAEFSEEMVWAYIRRYGVPYNALHDRGFPSIGCAPCTRAVTPGEDIRAGRWWWELPTHRECGLHSGKP